MLLKKNAKLILEDGSVFYGFSFASESSVSGEVVFSTGMVGYPESLTDPSYKGQILCLTYPLIGNYGIPSNETDRYSMPKNFESYAIHIQGLVISDYSFEYSHWSAKKSLGEWLKEHNIPGIYGVDTRELTKKLREKGSMLGKIIINGKDVELYDPNKVDLVKEVTIKKPVIYDNSNNKARENQRFSVHERSSAQSFALVSQKSLISVNSIENNSDKKDNFNRNKKLNQNNSIIEMSEIAKGAISCASAQSKPAISEHAQKHATHFSAGSVFDKIKIIKKNSKNKKIVILVDCGVKNNIMRNLLKRELAVIRVPYDYDFFKLDFDGIVLSNGPGDPKMCKTAIANIKKAIEKNIPVFGICLGNQILALAAGADTYKLKYGHRSQNQPCVMEGTKRCFITTQNHGYAVDTKTLPKEWEPLFTNINDNTNEGIKHKTKPFFSCQFHPEANPGPVDTEFLFDEFVKKLSQ
ncbi:carbamoyl phosphate synthase small subunit [Candidatus Woesearchaeota archaeon]|nr:carbamoyl phosphate synthase small subunit [Candidatus Woesearchaeota archaeon]